MGLVSPVWYISCVRGWREGGRDGWMGGWMDGQTPVWIMRMGLLSPPCNLLLRLVLVPAHSTHPLPRMLKGEPGSTGTTWLWLCGRGTATLSPDLAASLIPENSSEHYPTASCALLSRQLPSGRLQAG